MREVLRLSSEVGATLKFGPSLKDKGRSAFAAWIEYADAMNARAQGKTSYSNTDVVDRLYEAIRELGEIQPHDAREPAVPTLADVKRHRIQGGQAEASE